MTTNEIKKGMRIQLKCGWFATMEDNKKGNIRMATVEGMFTEMGSIYAHDIAACQVDGKWVNVTMSDKQKKVKAFNDSFFAAITS